MGRTDPQLGVIDGMGQGAAIGALLGGVLGRSKGGVLLGAAVGALASTFFVALSDRSDSPDKVSE